MEEFLDKTFVLDTNVILFDPLAINKFGKNKIVIPLAVIEEVDRFKKDQNENGRNARHFSRIIDDLREKGPLTGGVSLENGGVVFLSVVTREDIGKQANLDLSVTDNVILGAALNCRDKKENTTLISKDINLRLKADVLGVPAEDYGERDVSVEELYTGQRRVSLEEDLLSFFESERFLPLHDVGLDRDTVLPNEYFVLQLHNNDRRRLLGRYDDKKKGIVPLAVSYTHLRAHET